MHKSSAVASIRFPDPHGAFPGDILLRPPPVVVDANVLRNDILHACRTGQRTVLVTAANAGLLRLFCAEHVLPGSTKRRVASFTESLLTCLLGAATAYQEVQDRFTSAAAKTPGWASLATALPPAAVLGRACLHTLARSPGCDRSAAELAGELPFLGVAQGEAKVRQILRDAGPFIEVWRGRWQAGQVAAALLRYL